MSLITLFEWLGHSWVGTEVRTSTWGFAVIEMVHLLGLATFGGAMLVFGLRLLGCLLPRQTVASVAQALAPLLLGGLIVMAISGVLLVSDGPLRYYGNPAFRVKMLLLLIGIVLGVPLHRVASRSAAAAASRGWLRAATILSFALWLGVGLAGRAIGVL